MLFILCKMNDLSTQRKRTYDIVAFHKHRDQQTKLLEKRNSHSFLVCVDFIFFAALLSLGSVSFLLILEAFLELRMAYFLSGSQTKQLSFQSKLRAEAEEDLSVLFLEVNSCKRMGPPFPRLVFHCVLFSFASQRYGQQALQPESQNSSFNLHPFLCLFQQGQLCYCISVLKLFFVQRKTEI